MAFVVHTVFTFTILRGEERESRSPRADYWESFQVLYSSNHRDFRRHSDATACLQHAGMVFFYPCLLAKLPRPVTTCTARCARPWGSRREEPPRHTLTHTCVRCIGTFVHSAHKPFSNQVRLRGNIYSSTLNNQSHFSTQRQISQAPPPPRHFPRLGQDLIFVLVPPLDLGLRGLNSSPHAILVCKVLDRVV